MGNLTLQGSSSGQITLSPAAVAGTNTLTLPAVTGTVITTGGSTTLALNGSSSGTTTLQTSSVGSGTITIPAGTGTVAVQGVSSNIVSGTSQASTSGTAISFPSLPSWIKRITIMFNGVSTSGTSNIIVQLGTGSTTYASSNYLGSASTQAGSVSNFTSGFLIMISPAAVDIFYGQIIIDNISSNIWVASSITSNSNLAKVVYGAGQISLGAALTAVQVTTTGSDTFDAGSINILYE